MSQVYSCETVYLRIAGCGAGDSVLNEEEKWIHHCIVNADMHEWADTLEDGDVCLWCGLSSFSWSYAIDSWLCNPKETTVDREIEL